MKRNSPSEGDDYAGAPIGDRIIGQIKDARWFPFKSVESVEASVRDIIPKGINGKSPRIVLLDVRTEREAATIALAGFFHEAEVGESRSGNESIFTDEVATGVLVPVIREVVQLGSLSGTHGRIIFSGMFLNDLAGYLRGDVTAQVLKAEQSNTSFVLGDKFICKLYRRPISPDNPDFVLPEKLHAETHFKNVPMPYAQLVYEGDRKLSLLSVQEFIRNDGDYWSFLTGRLMEAFLKSIAEGKDEPVNLDMDTIQHVDQLAIVTGNLHRALFNLSGDKFQPQPANEEILSGLKKRVYALTEVIRNIHQRYYLDGEALSSAQFSDIIMKILERFDLKQLLSSKVMRVHGDLHLGQILKTPRGPMIIDFEGEPARSETERQAKDFALKDVSGMIRSLDYAAAYYPATSGISHSKAIYLSDLLTDRFKEKYWETAYGMEFLPSSYEQYLEMSRFFELEKALYELAYEANNRPAWTIIPKTALERIAKYMM
ncbi:MAG TPA: hypothetical protein VKU79_03670 [Thermoplasmataceae archaeon]|nr:hypothetical protein [Thermoplasmataceae archaeon]